MLRRFFKLAAFLFIFSFAFLESVSAQAETRFVFLTMGKASGTQISRIAPDGVRKYEFEFNDRGRGPKLKSRIKLDTDGLPLEIETTGNNYLKVPVDEKFSAAGGTARWKNSAEQGELKLAGKAFYVSMDGVPEELAILAQALLKTPSRRVALLPAGEAGIERAGEITLKEGDRERKVIAYEINGLGFTPTTVWLDEGNAFFALVSSWSSIVREGWEMGVPTLLKAQDDREAIRFKTLAAGLTRRETVPVAFINANLFDAETGKTIPNSTVVIEGNRIKAVGKGAKIAIPKNARTIDAKGKTLMPGLWDMHNHIFPTDGLLDIAAGVTTIRDLGNDTDSLLALKKKYDAGEEIGPRILMSGFMDGRGPFAAPTKVFVDDEKEAREAVDNYARLGYTGIKIYSSIKPELVPKIIELAHAKGLRVGGHVPAFMTAEQFVNAGADELQHVNFLFLNFFFDEVKDTRNPARFTAVAERAATLDLNEERVRLFIKLLKDRKIVVDPTVNIFEGMFTDRAGVISKGFAPVADRLPPQVRRGFLVGGLPVPEGKDERYRESAKALLRMVKMLYDNGVTIVAGTDSLAGFALHRELEIYVEAGIPAPEVLKIATLGAARVMKRDAESGSIAAGKFADLILVDGNPAERIGDIRRVSLVLKDGNLFEPAALYKNLGVRP